MEGIRKIFLVFVGILIAFASFSQEENWSPYPDTLRVKTDDKNTIILAIKNIREENLSLDDALWKSILGIMESSLQTALYDEGVRVTYEKVEVNFEEKVKVEVALLDESDIFWIDKEGITHNKSDRIEFEIVLQDVKILFSLNELAQLERVKELSIESVWNAKKGRVETSRVLYNGTMAYESGQLKVQEINHTNKQDFLEYRVGIGMGYYLDRFVPSFSSDLSYTSLDRFGRPKTKFGLLYTRHFIYGEDQEGDLEIQLNGFLSAYWAVTPGAKEYGLGIGYLVDQEGDFFKGNTFVISAYSRNTTRKTNTVRQRRINRTANTARTSFTPELIMADNFRQVYPALRFGLSF